MLIVQPEVLLQGTSAGQTEVLEHPPLAQTLQEPDVYAILFGHWVHLVAGKLVGLIASLLQLGTQIEVLSLARGSAPVALGTLD